MAWYYYLSAALLLSAALAAAAFLPLRIFIFYLRENKEDRAALTVRIFGAGFKQIFYRNAEAEVTSILKLGKWEFQLPVFRQSGPGQDSVAVEMSGFEYGLTVPRGLFSRAGLNLLLKLFRSLKPVLKKLTWKRFDLEVICGLEDPSLAGFIYGGSWAACGAVQGLLYQLFSFDKAPHLKIIPRFNQDTFRVCYEGELTMPLFRGLKLLFITRKIGGAVIGTSSH